MQENNIQPPHTHNDREREKEGEHTVASFSAMGPDLNLMCAHSSNAFFRLAFLLACSHSDFYVMSSTLCSWLFCFAHLLGHKNKWQVQWSNGDLCGCLQESPMSPVSCAPSVPYSVEGITTSFIRLFSKEILLSLFLIFYSFYFNDRDTDRKTQRYTRALLALAYGWLGIESGIFKPHA